MNTKLISILNNKEGESRLDKLIRTYQKVYGLKTIMHSEKVSKEFYSYCQRGKFFIEIIAHNSKREIFIQRDLRRNKNLWELIGGWINQNESFEEALDNVVAKETGSTLVEAIPIALIKNVYYTDKDNKVVHTGILYMGMLKDDAALFENGIFTSEPQKYLEAKDKKIAAIGQSILKKKVIQPPVNEIESYVESKWGQVFHKYLIKPISYIGGSKILKETVIGQIKKSDDSILDVACGDDLTVLRLITPDRIVVANDISRNSFKKISKKDKSKSVIFSNQNMVDMKFAKKFDVIIVKNVLHHLRNPEEIDYFFNNLKNRGSRFVIMDIVDPKLSLLARIWNKYYVWILRDQGELFINYEQFKQIMNLYFSDQKVKFMKIWTVKGPYMMATIN